MIAILSEAFNCGDYVSFHDPTQRFLNYQIQRVSFKAAEKTFSGSLLLSDSDGIYYNASNSRSNTECLHCKITFTDILSVDALPPGLYSITRSSEDESNETLEIQIILPFALMLSECAIYWKSG